MADKEKGYIYLYRSIQDNILWQDGEPFDNRSAFIDLIFMANFKDKELILRNRTRKIIKRGQLHTSIEKLANRWHWSVNKVRRYLRLLNELSMVHIDGTPCGTTLTIVNYEDFQVRRQTNGTPNGTADGTTNDTTSGITSGTTDGTTSGTRLNTLNTSKEKKEKKKKAAPLSPNAGKPKYHIIDEYEYWYEDGMWCRELINKGDANGDISG